VRRPLTAAAFVALLAPGAAAAQRPTVSPGLTRVWTRDTTLTVWIFVRPGVSLASAANRVRAAGGTVRTRSRWLHALSVSAPAAVLRAVAGDRAFRHLQTVGRWRLPPGRPDPARAPRSPTAGDTCPAAGDPVLGSSEMPYRQLDLRPLTDSGFDGSGVRILILDAGFNTLNPAFAGVTVTAESDFVFHDSIVRNDSMDTADAQFHGTAVWSLFAGLVPGRLRGIARGASYLLAKTEDIRSETRVEEDNYVAALEWADSIGVDIASSSLGYLTFTGFSYTPDQLNGDVAVTSVAAESAAARGILLVTAAGNAGPGFRTLDTPGDADSIITAGAEDSLGTIAGFSSRGPTADGRLKPDLTAPGVAVCTVVGNTVERLSGTSFATPILAAASALMKQVHPTLSPVALRDALRVFGTHHDAPDSTYGWGRPDVAKSATFPLGIVVQSPADTVFPSITPAFAWSTPDVPAFATPVSYRLVVARDSAFTRVLLDTTLSGTSVASDSAVKPATLFWRVDATGANGVTGSTGRRATRAPVWATLLTLSDSAGSSTNDNHPTFRWRSPAVTVPPGPLNYDLAVTRAGVPIPEFTADGITDTAFTIPQALDRNVAYRWSLVVHAGADTSLVASRGVFVVLDSTVPPATVLYQNFPNPFPSSAGDSTCLWFDLARPGLVDASILDLRGHPVRRFVPGPNFPAILAAGRYGRGGGGGLCDPRFTWDGTADDGRIVPAGVYLFKLRTPDIVLFKRIVFRGRK